MAKKDRLILEHLRSGETKREDAAFRLLYSEYYDHLIRYIWKNFSNLPVMEPSDLVEEAFLVLLNRIREEHKNPEKKRIENLSGFLFGVVRNKGLDEVNRKGGLKGAVVTSIEGEEIQLENHVWNPYTAPVSQLEEIVEDLWNQLGNEGCRELLDTFYRAGWTAEQIALERGGKNPANIRQQKKRCLGYLRELAEQIPDFHALVGQLLNNTGT